jgi:hypothetical protein
MTTAIANPTADSMDATPGCSFAGWAIADLNFEGRRALVEVRSVVGNPQGPRRRVDFQSMGQTYIAELEMMAVGFAIRGNA